MTISASIPWTTSSACWTPRRGIGRARARGPIRVCYMIDRLAAAGTEKQLVHLINNLDRRRVTPFLCLLHGEDPVSRALEPDHCTILRLGVSSLARIASVSRAVELSRFLHRHRIEVLQLSFPDSTMFGVLAGLAAQVPIVLRTRNNLGYAASPFQRTVNRVVNQLVQGTIANSEACRQSLLRDEGPSRTPIFVIENGVDLDTYSTLRPDRCQRTPRTVGIVANLRPIKDIFGFLRSAALVAAEQPDVVFRIAGDGELRPSLVDYARECGLAQKVSFLGSIANVPEFLATLDVAVLCSRSEGFSNALLEYMAAGCPIVATAVGGNTRLIQHMEQGLLVPPGNAPVLAEAINRLLTDPRLANRLGRAARLRAETHFSRSAMVRRLEDLYESLVAAS